MIFNKPGRITDDIYMLGPTGVPIFLLNCNSPVIFDAGFSFLGNKYAKDIKNVLGVREPEHLFLTHAHYDHCGSASVLKSHFPGLKVTSSEKAKDILNRPNAIKLMTTLSKEAERFAAKGSKKRPSAKPFEPVVIDRTIKGNDIIELEKGLSIQVIETPGHTRDHISYYIPEKKILIAGEAAGIPDSTGYIVTDCLVGYDMYVDSVEKLAQLEIEMLCLGHDFVYTGADAGKYIKRAVESCGKFLHLAKTCLEDEQGHMESVMNRIKQIEYDSKEGIKQSESAYMINLKARLNAVQNHLNNNTHQN
ncbi:MAG: MBL fold metallo-hydrolase [Deltaproteobacteria bacterium]|nr:MBL fold metallo-hydrolase [Deltaproteobacteria bacterium]